MTSLAQQLSIDARKEDEMVQISDKILHTIHDMIINCIKAHECQWYENYTKVYVEYPHNGMTLIEPIIEYVEFYYQFTKKYRDQLAQEFLRDGFQLQDLSLKGNELIYVVLKITES